MPDTPSRMSDKRRMLIIPILVIVFPIVYSVIAGIVPRAGGAVHASLQLPDPDVHPDCVRETIYMRYHHWELLTQVRDDVMRHGKRQSAGLIGLNRCQECHTYREGFCNHCHDAVNLYPECWGCHYYPLNEDDDHDPIEGSE